MLSISEEEFRKLFPNKEHIWELLNTKPKNEDELINKYLPSKIWRLNNLYYVANKDGDVVKFKMKRAQFIVYSYLFHHPRLIILKSRQQGISTLFLISFSDDAFFQSTINCGLMAQGREEASTLLERVKFLWDTIDPDILAFLNRRILKSNDSEFKFNNKSTLFIRTSFRSATLQRLHISEFAKIANNSPGKARETKTGTLQALAPGNIGIIESTAEGENDYATMWRNAVQQLATGRPLAAKDFYPVFLSWLEDPDCVEYEDQLDTQESLDYFSKLQAREGIFVTKEQKNFWITQYRELEGAIYQEYPATPKEAFEAAKDGTYWAKRYIECVINKGQRKPNLIDRNLPVYVACDLGHDDYFVELYFQFYQESTGRYTIRIVGEYYNNYEDMEVYCDEIKKFASREGVEIKEVVLPHDANVVELTAKGKTREEVMNSYGITNTVILDKMGLTNSREAVRYEMGNIWIDDAACPYIEDCFLGYTKEWNDELKLWSVNPKKSPRNHGADTVRYMIQYCQENLIFSTWGRDIPERGERNAAM